MCSLRGAMDSPQPSYLFRAIEDARRILGEYIELGQRDASQTVERLLAVLNREDLAHAPDRINRRRSKRLVEATDVATNPPV